MTDTHEPIAIIGMRGRFPGADDLDEFWRNLAEGVESITPLSREDMRAAGIPDQVTSLPGYVNAAPLLGDVDMFDAGVLRLLGARRRADRSAAPAVPRDRVGSARGRRLRPGAATTGPIGVFGGCELSTYLYQLYQNPEALGYVDGMQLMVTNDKDHLCTQVSYRLEPARPERRRADDVLHVAGRRRRWRARACRPAAATWRSPAA